jgi:hypothetical protein
MEDSLRRFLQVASLKREASGLDPEAVHTETVDAFSDHLQSRFEPLGHLVRLAIYIQQNGTLLFLDGITAVSQKHSIDRFHR